MPLHGLHGTDESSQTLIKGLSMKKLRQAFEDPKGLVL
jgi:hypothetical protein